MTPETKTDFVKIAYGSILRKDNKMSPKKVNS